MTAVPQPHDDRVHRFANRDFSRFGWQHRVYCVPIDEAEQWRFSALDYIVRVLLGRGDVLTPGFPPPREDDDSDSLTAVLDCGFGGGGWIEQVLEQYGGNLNLDVTGVDICLDQGDESDESGDDSSDEDADSVQEFVKKRWNLNAPFGDDQSNSQLKPETFDLINSRYLAEGINTARWPSYVRELRHMLKRGGWLQMVEIQFPFQSSNGTLPDESHLTRWWQWYSHALGRMNRNVRIGQSLGRLMSDDGFQHVTSIVRDLPVGEWDPNQRNLGQTNLSIAQWLLRSLSLFPFRQREGMAEGTYEALITGALAELRNPAFKLYYRVYISYGQRSP